MLWWVIIAAIIVTFVYWGSQTGPMGNGGGGGPEGLGQMNGETITPSRYQDALREVHLMYFFASGGSWPDKGQTVAGFDTERETYFRLLMIQKMSEMGVYVSEAAVARAASQRLQLLNRGNPVPPDVFAKQILAPQGLTLGDFERYLRHELGVQQLASVIGLGGELLPQQELRALYERENQELQTQAAFFSATDYLAAVNPAPDKIASFYSNQLARYRLPERIQVNYVLFPLSNHLAEASKKLNEITNLQEIISAVYEQRGTNFYSDAKSPEEAKQRILKEEQEGQALDLARRKAVEFATMLYTNEPMRPENLVNLAKAQGLTPLVTAPFSRNEPPAGLGVRADFLKSAFALSDDEPYSQTLLGEEGVYLISLNKRLPSEIPPLDKILPEVTQDFRFSEAAKAARNAAMSFAATATNITSAAAFNAACAAAKVKPVTVPPVALNSRTNATVESHVRLSDFKQVAFSTSVGHLSQLQPTSDGAFVVFVEARLPIDQARMAANLPAFERSMRQTRRAEAFNAWFNAEFNKVRPTIPFFQRQAQTTGAPR